MIGTSTLNIIFAKPTPWYCKRTLDIIFQYLTPWYRVHFIINCNPDWWEHQYWILCFKNLHPDSVKEHWISSFKNIHPDWYEHQHWISYFKNLHQALSEHLSKTYILISSFKNLHPIIFQKYEWWDHKHIHPDIIFQNPTYWYHLSKT